MENIKIEDFDVESLIPPSKEKIQIRNTIINKSIIDFGIKDDQKIIHFGCGSRKKSLLNYVIKDALLYTGVDINKDTIYDCLNENKNSNFKFENTTIQEFLDKKSDSNTMYDWTVLEGILDKNLYGDEQYVFVDTIIRKCLYISDSGVIIYFDGKKTKNEISSYNVDFIYAYLMSMYSKVTVARLNKDDYIFCVYKYYI